MENNSDQDGACGTVHSVTVNPLTNSMVICCSFGSRRDCVRVLLFLSSSIHWESRENSHKKPKAFQLEMHLRLTFPSGDVRLPHVLHPGFESGYLFFEASSSSLLRVSFSPE